MMDYPACFVSWCAMKPEVGANPLYHGCLLLSVQKDADAPVQVVDAVGFYGITPCSDTNPITRKLKKSTGLDIDLTGGFGELRHEEIRYLDKGLGLQGTTFHVSHSRFLNLRQQIKHDMTQQDAAIDEALEIITDKRMADKRLVLTIQEELAEEKKSFEMPAVRARMAEYVKAQVRPKDTKFKIRPGVTATPPEILSLERERGREKKAKPRLKPFEFRFSLTPGTFFTFADSHTCKNAAVNLLRRINLPLKWQRELHGSTSTDSIPRWSGSANQEDFFLHSTGVYATHTSKRTGNQYYFREWRPDITDLTDKPQVYWSVPPNSIIPEATAEETSQAFIDAFLIGSALHSQISTLVTTLQQIHETLLQSPTIQKLPHREALFAKLEQYIHAFRIPKQLHDAAYVEEMLKGGDKVVKSIELLFKSNKPFEVSTDGEGTVALSDIELEAKNQTKLDAAIGQYHAKSQEAEEVAALTKEAAPAF